MLTLRVTLHLALSNKHPHHIPTPQTSCTITEQQNIAQHSIARRHTYNHAPRATSSSTLNYTSQALAMRSILFFHLSTAVLAFPLPLLWRRTPATPYNVVSVDGHDAAPQNLQIRNPEPAPASYSVVPVDGGPAAFTAPNNQPNSPASQPPPTRTETHIVTATVTDAETPATVLVTVTPAPQANTPQSQAATVTQTVPGSPPPGETQTKPYDNGQWHTTYYFTTVVPTSAPTPSPSSSSSTQQAHWNDARPDAPSATPSPAPPQTNVAGQFAGSGSADTDPQFPGNQEIGSPVASDPVRQAWLEGQWSPWKGDGQDGRGGNGGQR